MLLRFDPIRAAVLTLVAAAPLAVGQDDGSAVHGACQVNVESGYSSSAVCNVSFSGVEGDTVPPGAQLVIEHVSALCAGPKEVEIAFLSLHTQSQPGASSQPAYLPLQKRVSDSLPFARYTAAGLVKLYAGANTQVILNLTLEGEAPARQATPCDVRFQGRLVTQANR